MNPSLPATASRGLVWPELISGILLYGVEILAYDVRIDLQDIELKQNIPCEL